MRIDVNLLPARAMHACMQAGSVSGVTEHGRTPSRQAGCLMFRALVQYIYDYSNCYQKNRQGGFYPSKRHGDG